MTGEETREPVEGDGYAVAGLDGPGEGYVVRRRRRLLAETGFPVNATGPDG